MRRCVFSIVVLALNSLLVNAQTGTTHTGRSTLQPMQPLIEYQELSNHIQADEKEWAHINGTFVSWGSASERYKKEAPASIVKPQMTKTLTAWRGERVSAQFVLSSKTGIENISYEISDLVNSKTKERISNNDILSGFLRYVMTDELNKDGKGTCVLRPDATMYDSTLVADVIDHHLQKMTLAPMTSQGVWVRVWVPQSVSAGVYKGSIKVKSGDKVISTLVLDVKVVDRVLKAPLEWSFDLDLWQNPFSVARYYGVTPWSKEHFAAMDKYMEMYRDAGGKSITTSIMHKPWDGQTHDYYETMVTWVKRADGTWLFDYTVFDMWVEYMMKIGVKDQINCYTMIPWALSFKYLDQATGEFKVAECKPGSDEYSQMWGSVISSLAAHLKEKGWFDIAHIAIDERPMEDTREAIRIIKKADKDFKIAFAGNYHEELMAEVDYYASNMEMGFPKDIQAKRKSEGKVSVYYTCCSESTPNVFTFSPLAESEFICWYSAKMGYDGFLRWAFNHWGLEPLVETRYTNWGGGDTFIVYPAGRSSARFERFINGVQSFEKVAALREEFESKGDTKSLKKIDEALSLFDKDALPAISADEITQRANEIINSL